MFGTHFKKSYSAFLVSMLLVVGITGCGDNSTPPKLMKAVKQFSSEQELKDHVFHIRKDHMDLLKHKRDETMIRGIRTKENSLNACIDCHVPVEHKGKVLRHTDSEHFCATCHNYVATNLDCFQCHVDHPVQDNNAAEMINTNKSLSKVSQSSGNFIKLAEEKPHSKAATGEASSE